MNFNCIPCRLNLHFYDTIRCFLTNSDTDWKTNQVAIAKFNTDTFVTVICQNFVTFVNKTPKGEYRYAWGINFPKELAPFDVHLIPVNVKDEASLELTNRIEEALVNKGYEVLTDDRNERVVLSLAIAT